MFFCLVILKLFWSNSPRKILWLGDAVPLGIALCTQILTRSSFFLTLARFFPPFFSRGPGGRAAVLKQALFCVPQVGCLLLAAARAAPADPAAAATAVAESKKQELQVPAQSGDAVTRAKKR